MTTHPGTNVPLFKALASPFSTFHQAFAICEDCWTWTTRKGNVYEDVVLLDLDSVAVKIQHKYGVDTIARAELDHDTQSLINDSETAETENMGVEVDDHFAHARPMSRAASFSHAA